MVLDECEELFGGEGGQSDTVGFFVEGEGVVVWDEDGNGVERGVAEEEGGEICVGGVEGGEVGELGVGAYGFKKGARGGDGGEQEEGWYYGGEGLHYG